MSKIRANRKAPRREKKGRSYSAAGVDIDVMMHALRAVRRSVASTYNDDVIAGMGSFGGLFRAPSGNMILVGSIDGVGTKLKVAAMAGRHDSVGRDLVNHCVNDILVQGARPLFFLDYVGTAKLDPAVFRAVIAGLVKGCRENGCVLLGGETAEMPGLYPSGEYDLVGAIVGVVARKELVDGRGVRAGDVLIGLPSNGLHTNGYSLARHIIFDVAGLGVGDVFPGLRRTVGEVLLSVHRSYLKPIMRLRRHIRIHGMAHITGGGLVDNVPRAVPEGLGVEITRSAWRVPTVFRFLEEAGGVDPVEMYRVFNMGIGMVVIVRAADVAESLRRLVASGIRGRVIGRVVAGGHGVRFSD